MKAINEIIIVLFLGLSSVVFSQEDMCSHTVQGKLLDAETKKPIPYVSIKVKNVEKNTITNLKGEFLINGLCSDRNTLIISCFGYCDSICKDYYYQQGKIPHIYLTQEVLELGSITIQAKKSKEKGTKSVSQITLKSEDIKKNPTLSLASLIKEEQGVTLTSTGTNVQLPVIHGLSGNRILILNNGLKHGFQNWGSDHAPEIDISSANSITVLKGAAGVRFGPEALGGAIIIEPNPLHFNDAFYTTLGTGYQTNGRGVFTNVEIGKGFKKWSSFLSGNYTKIGDRHTPNYDLTNSGKEEKSLNTGLRYHHKKWDFKMYYSYVNQNLALLRASVAESGNAFVKAINSNEPIYIKPFSYTINEPNQLTQHHFGKAEINWRYSGLGKLTFRAGKQINKRAEYDVRRNADKPIIDLDLFTTDYQLEWKHFDWMKLDGMLGIQMFAQDNDNNSGTGTTPFIPNYNSNRYSAFAIESLKFGKNTIEGGIRLDNETITVRGRETNQAIFRDEFRFTNITSSVGYIREISENATFRTNFGTAWRAPNMAELYSFGQHGFKTSFGLLRYYTNEDGALKTDKVITMAGSSVSPEKGYKFINELQIQKKDNAYTFTFYSNYIENYIFDRPIAVIGTIRGPMPVFIFDQADAFFIGTDLSWKKEWLNTLSGTFGISYLWSKNLKKNEPLINQPPIRTNYKLVWNTKNFWKINSSQITLKPSYTFKQFQAPNTIAPNMLIDGTVVITPDSEIFDFKDAPSGYFLFDAAWCFKWNQLKASITIQNVFNTKYRDYLNEMRYFADEPGRNILFTFNYIFKSN